MYMSAHRCRPIGLPAVCTDKISIKFRLSEDNVNLFTLLSARILVQASEKANLKREKTEKSYIRILIHPLAGRAIGNSQFTIHNKSSVSYNTVRVQ